jgi:hypothetical protein
VEDSSLICFWNCFVCRLFQHSSLLTCLISTPPPCFFFLSTTTTVASDQYVGDLPDDTSKAVLDAIKQTSYPGLARPSYTCTDGKYTTTDKQEENPQQPSGTRSCSCASSDWFRVHLCTKQSRSEGDAFIYETWQKFGAVPRD